MKDSLAIFEKYEIRRIYDEETETWYFSVVDIIQALLQQPDYQTARKYWNKLKQRLSKEGSESVTNCHRLKLEAADGKKYLSDVADLGTFTRADGITGTAGTSGKLADIDLVQDSFHSQFTDSIPLTAEAQTLPDIQGAGQVRNLREAVNNNNWRIEA